MTIQAVLDFSEKEKPRLYIGEPENFKLMSNMYIAGPMDNVIPNLLDCLLNRSYALLHLQTTYKDVVLKIIKSKKIKWSFQGRSSWWSPKTIRDKNDLRKKINLMKRLVKEYNTSIAF